MQFNLSFSLILHGPLTLTRLHRRCARPYLISFFDQGSLFLHALTASSLPRARSDLALRAYYGVVAPWRIACLQCPLTPPPALHDPKLHTRAAVAARREGDGGDVVWRASLRYSPSLASFRSSSFFTLPSQSIWLWCSLCADLVFASSHSLSFFAYKHTHFGYGRPLVSSNKS